MNEPVNDENGPVLSLSQLGEDDEQKEEGPNIGNLGNTHTLYSRDVIIYINRFFLKHNAKSKEFKSTTMIC